MNRRLQARAGREERCDDWEAPTEKEIADLVGYDDEVASPYKGDVAQQQGVRHISTRKKDSLSCPFRVEIRGFEPLAYRLRTYRSTN